MHEETDQLARLKTALAERYRVERELGHGGMATVYLAEDLKHDRPVALKVLLPELAAALGSERFLREVRITARLHHPHILPLLDSGEAGGFVYYAMPYVEGESLRDRLTRDKQLPLDDALQIAREVADALSYAHSHDVVHRDIKPENILLESGHAVVADFGIARAITAAAGERLTETGIAVGTPQYMSPEQAAGSVQLDGRSDLYSLGCVLYEMLAGHPPFLGNTAQELLARHSMDAVPSLRAARPLVPQAVEEAVQKALAKTPADRFATGMQFATALETASRWRPLRRRSVITAAAVVIVVAAGALVWLRRPHGSTATLDPNLIAVMPFRATGATPALRQLAAQIPDIFWMKITGDFGPRVTDPSTVRTAWHQAGGTPDAGLPAQKELRIAREQGAGLLVRGMVGGDASRVTITASLVDVSADTVRVPPTTVVGPADRWIPLLDTLTAVLLEKDFGVTSRGITELDQYAPRAVQAYLAGIAAQNSGDFARAQEFFAQALDADSTFATAAFQEWDAGETDTVAARWAWEHQDQLNARKRAKLRAQVGWRYGAVHSEAEVIAQWDSITERWPNWRPGWWELGEELLYAGGVTDEPDWLKRTRNIWQRIIPAEGPASTVGLRHAIDAAAVDGDVDAMRAYLHHWAALPMREGSAPLSWYPQYEWRLATMTGDSAAARRAFPAAGAQRIGTPDAWELIPLFAIADGRGSADGDRAARLTETWSVKMVWARARGQHTEWMRWRDSDESPLHDGMNGAVIRLRDALFLGEAEDSAVSVAARYVERVAHGATASRADRAIARCWSTLWHVGHGDLVGARNTARSLENEVKLPNHLPVCAGLIDVLSTQAEGGNVRQAVRHWNGVVDSGPVPVYGSDPFAGSIMRDGTLGLDNVLLARWLLQVGDTTAALRAARRRFYHPGTLGQLIPGSLLVEALREEGRLAAMTGDTAGAIKAYNHYLALRENPDYEPWREQRDQVRRELAALVGEPHR